MSQGPEICENCGGNEVAYGLPVCTECAEAGVLDDEGDVMEKDDEVREYDLMKRGINWTENEKRAFAAMLANAPRLQGETLRDLQVLLRPRPSSSR